MRPTEAVVDLAAFGRNVEILRELAGAAQLCVVIKADGYGHGAVRCSRVATEAGASWLAVALVEEAVELRAAGITTPLLLLSEPPAAAMTAVVEHDLTATVYTTAGVNALAQAAAGRGGSRPVSVHVNVDTGMNRVGLRSSVPWTSEGEASLALDVFDSIGASESLHLSGLWTHFAVADEPDRPETAQQLARFEAVRAALGSTIDDDVVVHAANSAGLLAFNDARFDMVRVGIGAYGVAPSPALKGRADLEPVLTLRSELSMVKNVFAGEAISYGLRHQFAVDTIVGTIQIGYADGLRRDSFAQGVSVLVNGVKRPIVGVVTMDQTMIDLGPASAATVGDEVVLIGAQGAESIGAQDIALQLGTIPYEVICAIGPRVRRRYLGV